MFIAKDTHFSLSACVLRPAGARYGKLYATDKGCRCYRSNKLNYHSGTSVLGLKSSRNTTPFSVLRLSVRGPYSHGLLE